MGKTLAKPERERASAEVAGMQRDLRNLQKALADLVDAVIAEEKPSPKEARKLTAIKKKVLNENITSAKENPSSPKETKRKRH